MEKRIAKESSGAAGSPFHQVTSIGAGYPSNNSNALCLFYSANSSALRTQVIQSSRAPNSWIASLRKQSIDPSSSKTRWLDGGQDDHELSATTGRIVPATVYGRSRSSPSLMNGPFSSRSSSDLAFYRSASLESIQRSRRLRQLALQSTTKVRSLTARESTAAAERWRYIQSVLERRRRESLERRERFIRQPLENIIRHKAAQQQFQHVQHWANITRRSILKNHDGHQPDQIARPSKWIQRHVRFDIQQDKEQTDHHDDPDDDNQRVKLPVLSLPEEMNRLSTATSPTASDDGMRRLPPLRSGIGQDGPARPSWVERQVAKVRQRKLWARQQENNNKTACPAGPAGPAGIKVLKRTASLLVNVSDESDSGSVADDDSLEDRSAGQLDSPIPRSGQSYLAWEVWLDKEETAEEKEKRSDPIPDAYGGWPHFPIRLASGIKARQESLREKRASRRKSGSSSHDSDYFNSFTRRKRFSKSLLMAVIRLKDRNMAKRASAIHQPSVGHSSGHLFKPGNLQNGLIPSENHQTHLYYQQDQAGSLPLLPNIPEEMTDPESEEQFSPDRCDPTDDLIRSPASPDLTNRGKDGIEIQPEDTLTIQVAGPISPVWPLSQPTDSDPAHQASVIEESIHPESISGLEGLGGASCNLHSCDPQGLEPLTSQPDWPVEAKKRIDNAAGPSEEAEECCRLKNLATESTDPVATAQSDGLATRVQSWPDLTATPISTTGWPVSGKTRMTAVSSSAEQDGAVIRQAVQQADQVPDDQGPLSVGDGQRLLVARPASILLARPIRNQEIPSNPSKGFEDLTSHELVSFNGSSSTLVAGLETQDHVTAQPTGPASWLDKKTKEARNVLRMTSATIATQTEPVKPALMEDEPAHIKNDVDKSMASPTCSSASSGSDSTGSENCHCLHRAVLTCLLPEAADTLASLELIRRQLKKARIRGQQQQQQQQQHPPHSKPRHGRQPLSARVDVSQTGTEVPGSNQKEGSNPSVQLM